LKTFYQSLVWNISRKAPAGGSSKFQSPDFEIFPMVKNESNSIEHNYKMS
jgi:hypothetical protein